MTNPERLAKLMKKHGWDRAEVASILGMKPSRDKYWSGHMTIHRLLTVPNHNPKMGWDNLFILLDAHLKNNQK